MKKATNQRGITLIELMIAQLLGLIIIGGALSLIGPSISVAGQQQAEALVQETAGLAMDTLSEAVEQAGYGGCGTSADRRSVVDPGAAGVSTRLTNWAYDPFAVRVIAADDRDQINQLMGSDWNSRRYRQDSIWYGDLLMVQSVGHGAGDLVSDNVASQTLTLTGDRRDDFAQGQLIGISDCNNHVMLQIDRTQPPVWHPDFNTTTLSYAAENTINCAVADSGSTMVSLDPDGPVACGYSDAEIRAYRFHPGSMVWPINSHLYYLAQQPGTNYPSLYRTGTATNAARLHTELIAEGIENMRLIAGIDTDDDGAPDHYQQSPPAPNERFVSLRLSLMASSLEDRGHGANASLVDFPDRSGALVPCRPDNGTETASCPPTQGHSAVRRVYHREVMLRNPI